MSTVGLDTSVVVRFLTGEPAPLAVAVNMRLEAELSAGNALVVADLVVAEAYFVLHKHYGIPKPTAQKSLADMLAQPGFAAEPNGVATEALHSILTTTAKPGFVDQMIHAKYSRLHAKMLTLEKAAKRLKHVDVIEIEAP